MASIKVVESVMAPQDRVFAFISNFEKAPQYSNYWKSVMMLKHDQNATMSDITAEADGRKMTSVTRITSFPDERIEAETIGGDGKGTKLTFRLQKVNAGTHVTLEGDVVLPGFARMLGGLVKGRIEVGMQEELKTIKNAVEKAYAVYNIGRLDVAGTAVLSEPSVNSQHPEGKP